MHGHQDLNPLNHEILTFFLQYLIGSLKQKLGTKMKFLTEQTTFNCEKA